MREVRPEFTDTIAIKQGRHPVREKVHADRYVPNDVYATQQTRFQIITGEIKPCDLVLCPRPLSDTDVINIAQGAT